MLADDSVSVRSVDNAFNSGWLFRLGAGEAAPFPETPDVNWMPVTLPHIQNLARVGSDRAFAFQRQPRSDLASAWYRRHVTLPEVSEGKMIYLTLCGDATDLRIWVNGHKFDAVSTEKSCAEYNITQRFRVGSDFDNVIAIENRVTSSGVIAFPGTAPTAGISLSVRNRVHLVAEHFELLGPVMGSERAHIRLRTAVANHRDSATEVTVQNQLFGPDGELMGSSEQVVAVPPGDLSPITNDITFPAQGLQLNDSGHSYRVTTTLFEASEQLDQIESVRDDAGFTEIRHSHLDQGQVITAN
ncbi:MAG: hypothetical protein SynsKO_31670 [Synoicihabitans sp.]